MNYYPVLDKVKVVLDLTNYTTKKELEHAKSTDTPDLAAKKDFIALKAEFDQQEINKLVNDPINLNNIKTDVDKLDVGELKTVPKDIKKLSDVADT